MFSDRNTGGTRSGVLFMPSHKQPHDPGSQSRLLTRHCSAFRVPHATCPSMLLGSTKAQNPPFRRMFCVFCAPGGTRTPNSCFEGRHDIRFTTGASEGQNKNALYSYISRAPLPQAFLAYRSERSDEQSKNTL